MQRANEAAGAEHSGRPCRQEAGGRRQELTRQKSQSRRATGRRVRPARVLRGEQDVTAGEEHRSQERTWSKILPITLGPGETCSVRCQRRCRTRADSGESNSFA